MSSRVLVVEDTEDNRRILRDLLASAGYDVVEAVYGAEGLSAVARFMPALVVLDIQLPVIDGYEVARRLKADPKTRDIPIVAVTSYALTGDEEKSRASGCDAYVAKPFSPKQLLATIRRLLPGDGKVA